MVEKLPPNTPPEIAQFADDPNIVAEKLIELYPDLERSEY